MIVFTNLPYLRIYLPAIALIAKPTTQQQNTSVYNTYRDIVTAAYNPMHV